MRTRTFWIAGAASLVLACSSDDSGVSSTDGDSGPSDATVAHDARVLPPPSGADAQGVDSATGDDSSATGDDSSATGDDAAPGSDSGQDAGADASPPADAAGSDTGLVDAGPPDCGNVVNLHPAEAGAGPYCPFSTAMLPGLTCAFGQHCCEPITPDGGLSSCASDCTSLADSGTDWACQDTTNCPGGQVCCAVTTGVGTDPGCTAHFLHGFHGTVCATSCAAGAQLQVCESTAQCLTGTCQPTRGRGADFGVCQ